LRHRHQLNALERSVDVLLNATATFKLLEISTTESIQNQKAGYHLGKFDAFCQTVANPKNVGCPGSETKHQDVPHPRMSTPFF